MNNLLLYKASAGSGKTFKLTEKYLEILFKNPDAYKNILAVTFTNKATEEMKNRILMELYKLADNKESKYIEAFCDPTNTKEVKELREKAQHILSTILHDYSRFKISTIDRFFQQIIRSFIREIGLNGNYNLELDNKKVLEETVAEIMLSLDDPKYKDLLKWLVNLAEQKIQNGSRWNFKDDITQLGLEIFKETYQHFSAELQEKITDRTFLQKYTGDLKKLQHTFQSEIQKLAKEGLDMIHSNGLIAKDFKAHTITPLETFAKGNLRELTITFRKLPEKEENYYTKTTTLKADIQQVVNNGLNDLIEKFISTYDSGIIFYNTADAIIKYIPTLGVLSDINTRIEETNTENNSMLLSESTNLLHSIINSSDTPFVYEKIGTHIDHYLLDEFQDTSALQWENFKPLIENSLADGYTNLIVGDVKQSIYRWRNSNWRILGQQLQEEYQEEIKEYSLQTNWRSDENIVNFNNAFFKLSIENLQTQFNSEIDESSSSQKADDLTNLLTNSYSDLAQVVPPEKQNKKGFINLQFIDEKEEEENSWKETALNKLAEAIEYLQDCKYELKDIAILTRTKDEGRQIASFLLEYKNSNLAKNKYRYDIISEESLCISNSPIIQFITTILTWTVCPYDRINNLTIAYLYQHIMGNDNSRQIVSNYLANSEMQKENFTSLFTEEEKNGLHDSKNLPLFELIEKLIEIFHLSQNEEDVVYLQAYQDAVLEYIGNKGSDRNAFIKWWSTKGISKTISTSETQNAIKIMTIHKSKGLDFGIVILPFCDWSIDHGGNHENILWCEPKQQPFNQLPLVPVKYGKTLSNSLFHKEYFTEKIYAYIDNINTLYVAFTRPKYGLICFTPINKKKKTEKIGSVKDLLREYAESSLEKGEADLTNIIIGELNTPAKEETSKEQTEERTHKYYSTDPKNKLKLRFNTDKFIGTSSKKNYGNLMHHILEQTKQKSDVGNIVRQLVMDGIINEKERQEINEKLNSFFDISETKDWFSNKYKIVNERTILTPNGEKYRPDKILIGTDNVKVIDYKFGEEKNPKYERQIRHYMELLKDMGYTNISGNIYYASTNTIETF